MASRVRIRHGSSMDLASDQHAVAEVQRLLSRLDGAKTAAIRKITAKAAIREFANYYFDHMPSLADHPDTVRALLEQLIASAGNVSWKQMRELKKSSAHALELLGRLLDKETNQNASEFRSAIHSIPVKSFRDMKLDKHLTSNNSQPDVACLVVSLILELRSDITLDLIVESTAAQDAYYEWEDAQNQEAQIDNDASPGGSGYFEVKTAVDPVKWSEVNVEELYQLVDSFNDPNEDSEENVKKSDSLGIEAEEAEVSDPLGITRIDSKRFQKSKTKSKFWAKRLRFVKKRSSDEEDKHTKQLGEISEEHAAEVDEDEGSELVNDSRLALGSSSPYEEDFNPVLFLLDVHRSTPFSQLEFGMSNLRKIVNNRQNLMRELVRDNFDEFVSCKDAIDSIHDLCSTEVKLSSSDKVWQSNTGAVLPLLKSVCQKMSQLYSPLFQRKDEADRIRHVLTLLRRFTFLFNMPGVLQNNIKLQKYDAVVRDYRKLAQVQEIDVDLLGEIIAEIHRIIDRFRGTLLSTLNSPNGNFTEQIRTIGILFDLDSKENPACYFLNCQFEYICSQIEHMKDTLEKTISENASAKEQFSVECIQNAENILRSRISMLWKLASEFSGQQIKGQTAGRSNKVVFNRFYEHFQTVSSKFCLFISTLLFPSDKLQSMPGATEKIICILLSLLEYFNELDLPQELIFEFHNLCRECCNYFIEQMFCEVASKIHIPIPEDLWQIDERTDHTGVVVLFSYVRSLILRVLQTIAGFKKISPNCIEDQWISAHVGPPLLEIFCIVFDGIHESVFHSNATLSNEQNGNPKPQETINGNSVKRSHTDFRLILTLHNLAYCRNDIIPNIWDSFIDLTPEFSSNALDSKLQEIISLTLVLEQLSLDTFLKRQTLAINGLINDGVLLSAYPWDDAPELQEVRGYVYEILIKLVFVHDQLSSVGASPTLAGNVIADLLFHLLIAFQATTTFIDKFSSAGCEQLLLEIEFIESSLSNMVPHRTEITPLLRQIKSHLFDGISQSVSGRRSELLQNARSASMAMFGCFTGA